VLALLGACALALLGLRALQRRAAGASAGVIEVVQRVALEPRKSLYVVRAGQRVLLIGCGESGGPALVAELSSEVLEQLAAAAPVQAPPAVLEALRRAVRGAGS
jgi:flagellar biogenesis protein FliO